MIVVARCPACNTPISEGEWTGSQRYRCRNRRCGRRVLVESNGYQVRCLLVDKAPAAIPQSR